MSLFLYVNSENYILASLQDENNFLLAMNQVKFSLMVHDAPNPCARKGGKESGEVKGEYGGTSGEEEENADYGGLVQSSQQHVAPSV